MEQVIYGDILFVINFSMDFLSLYITALILHRRLRAVRLVAAASIGAFCAVASVFISFNRVYDGIIDIAFSLLICFTAFGRGKILRTGVTFASVTFMLGGCITALYNIVGTGGIFKLVGSDDDTVILSRETGVTSLMIFAAVAGAIAWISFRIISVRKSVKNIDVTVVYGDKSVTLRGLVDSGNLLSEPLGGSPVILTGYSDICGILPDNMKDVFEKAEFDTVKSLMCEDARRVRFIPSCSTGGEKLLIAFLPDSVRINNTDKRACVAVCGDKGHYGECDALVPSGLL